MDARFMFKQAYFVVSDIVCVCPNLHDPAKRSKKPMKRALVRDVSDAGALSMTSCPGAPDLRVNLKFSREQKRVPRSHIGV